MTTPLEHHATRPCSDELDPHPSQARRIRRRRMPIGRASRLATWLVTTLVASFGAACGGDGGTGVPEARSVAALGPTTFTGATDAELSQPLQVRVTGSDGNPFAGQPVTWAVTAGAGTVSASTTTTDASGTASVTWTLGPAAGANTVTATAAGLGSVTFTATASFETLEPTVDIPVSGDLEVERVIIPAGVVVTLTGPTRITAAGEVTIAGTLEGDCQALEIVGGAGGSFEGDVSNACVQVPAASLGPDLSIQVDGPLDMRGTVLTTGNLFLSNTSALTPATFAARAGGGAQPASGLSSVTVDPCFFSGEFGVPEGMPPATAAPGQPGLDGQNISGGCSGPAVVQDAVFRPGPGGLPGAPNLDDGGDDGPATGSGMPGGNGGKYEKDWMADVTYDNALIWLSDGADGGSVDVTATNPGQSAIASGGDGGNGGGLEVTSMGTITIGPGGLDIVVGSGGEGGGAVAQGADGRDGGAEPAQKGGSATSRGGEGGTTTPGTLTATGDIVFQGEIEVTAAPAGNGGDATSMAGKGGDGGSTVGNQHGAAGGDMIAHGGDGGDDETRVNGRADGFGGDGGDITLAGGAGGDGYDFCADPTLDGPGGDGGDGGSIARAGGTRSAPGKAGQSGPGGTDGVDGTFVIESNTGNAGDGGAGEVAAGVGGAPGSDDGMDPTFDGQRGDPVFAPGVDAARCNTPPVLTPPDPAPETPRDTPVEVVVGYSDLGGDAPDLGTWTVTGLDASEGSLSAPQPMEVAGQVVGITFTFTPTPGFQGTATFQVRVADALGAQSETIDVEVEVNNAEPLFNDGEGDIVVQVPRGGQKKIDLSFNDADGDEMTYSVVDGAGPDHGSLTPATFPASTNGVTTTYQHDGSAGDSDMFSVQADDGMGGVVVGRVLITIVDNAAPECTDSDKLVELLAGESVVITLSATDAEGELITFDLLMAPTLGTVTGFPINGGTVEVEYTSNGTPGADRFTYTVTDASGNQSECAVRLHVRSGEKLVLTTGSTNTAEGIIRFDPARGMFEATVPAPPEANGLSPLDDGSFLAAIKSGALLRFDPFSGLPVTDFGSSGVVTVEAGVVDVTYLPDGTILVTNVVTGEITLVAADGTVLEGSEILLEPGIDKIEASPDGSKIFVFQRNDPENPVDDEFLILDGVSKEVIEAIPTTLLLDMEISPDGKKLILTNVVLPGVLRFDVYDIEAMAWATEQPILVEEAAPGSGGIAFTPDGSRFYLTDTENGGRALAFDADSYQRRPEEDITGVPVIAFREILFTLDGLTRIFLGPESMVVQDVTTGEFGPARALPGFIDAKLYR